MATIQAQRIAQFQWGATNPHLGDELDKLTEVVSMFDSYVALGMLQGGRGAYRLPPDQHWGVGAQRKMTSFFDDFYNRIYIVPAALDAGNLLSTQNRSVVLWNAYLTQSALEAAGLGPQGGITLSLPTGVSLPYDLEPLRELTFTVQIELSGPPVIDSYVAFTVDGVTYNVPISGRRIVLFPFAPNWGSPVDETITHRSWVIAALDGSEQTGSESGEIPRRSLEYNINLRSAEQAQKCENLLFAWQSRFFGVPHWGEESRLDADVEAGALVLPFDTFGLSLEAGTLVALYRDDEAHEIREVEEVRPDGVVLTTALEGGWPQGSRVYPCFVGLANQQLTSTRETSVYGRMSVAFDFEPSVTPGNTALNAATLTYRGKELHLEGINWRSAMPMAFTADTDVVDQQAGKFVPYTSAGFTKIARRHNWTLYNRADIFAFRQFLGRRQGVARSVYMPSGTADFTMAAPILDNEDILVVRKNEYGALAGAHPARRDIIIRLRDGRYFCRRIVTTADFDAFTRLQLDSSLGAELTPDDVEQISFLSLYRLESPATTIRYLTDSKATVEARMIAKMTED